MRSMEPIPGNPWPHDMVLTIEDAPHSLYELLWIREAHELQLTAGDLPPLLTNAPPKAGLLADATRFFWTHTWEELWSERVAHEGKILDKSIFDQLMVAEVGSDERAQLFAQVVGPSWRDRTDDEAITDGFEQWNNARFEEFIARRRGAHQSPERRSLDALIGAWSSGLIKIVVIPCEGSFTRRIGQSALLVTDETRGEPLAYSAALDSFANSPA